ncbi:hypothetical protein PMKS-001463 [Pichia membranifaciens]|uniref:SCP domain-containing protein n=1 Tax=Pichia membranifaciens TaxID=4926 RepID=A0A1Q2YER6_9ASCO|nr:hypothetical protein PMKS-001463 [Pichia membranifaciens]
MQLSKISVLSLLSAVATAAPVVETVTNYYVTTVIVEGQTSAVNDAPVFSTSATAAAAYAEATPSPTTFETSYVSSTDAPEASSSTVADYQQKQADQPASSSSTEAATTTSSSSSAPSSTDSSGSGGSDFASQILAEHNAKRALHGVSNLSWDDTLASYAQNYADSYDCSGTLTHSGGQYGENLALGYTTTGSVDAWYSEGNGYNYGSGCSVYDHFTQVIWESTTKVGCGFKQCDSYWGTYIICSYDPAGNFVGKCDSQVVPPV